MSRGSVREDDQEEVPLVPPRASLHDGVANYVTPRDLEQLHRERAELIGERARVTGSDNDRRHTRTWLDGRLALLQERIGSAHLIEPASDHTEVRSGSTVTRQHLTGPLKDQIHTWTIVGADEAVVKERRIAFTAPLARTLMGHRVGDELSLPMGGVPQHFRITHIA